MAPEVGLEPTTRRLTAGCSTIELLWKLKWRRNLTTRYGCVKQFCLAATQRVHDRILLLLGQRERVIAGGMGIEPLFPKLIEAATGMDAA